MNQLVMSTTGTQLDRTRITFQLDAEVLGAETARRKASAWLLMNVGNLLAAENPELVIREDGELWWRFDVLLTSTQRGRIGTIGRIHFDAQTGEPLGDRDVIEELWENARTLYHQS